MPVLAGPWRYSGDVILLALVSGLLGLFISLALRRDTKRARDIREGGGLVDESFVLLSLPGFSLILLAAGVFGFLSPGIGGWLGDFWGYLVLGLLALVALGGFWLSALGLLGRPVPSWLAPKWYRAD